MSCPERAPAALALPLLGVLLGLQLACGPEPPPSVVLFLADDQGWNGTSLLQDPALPDSASDFYRTPALEGLAAQGIRFSNAYAPHGNCSPSRMSIQTGKSPARLGSTDLVNAVPDVLGAREGLYTHFYVNKPLLMKLPIAHLPKEETTIGELLKEHAPEYVTAHFGKWHMNGGSPGHHGYDEHSGNTGNTEGGQPAPDPKRIRSVTRRAIGFLEERAADGKPFFLQISHYAVHKPIQAMPETIARTRERKPGKRHHHPRYAAMTEDLDEGLRDILAKIDGLGLGDHSYFIYTSDNGAPVSHEVTTNAPLSQGKPSVREGGVRVPLVIRGPGIAPGSLSHSPAIGWDLLPTIADWAGIRAELPPKLDGGSLRPVLENSALLRVERPSPELVWFFPHYRDQHGVRPQAALRSDDHKLFRDFESGKDELYDLRRDPAESQDLGPSEPERTRELGQRLSDYLAEVGAREPGRNPEYDPSLDLGRAMARESEKGKATKLRDR